MDLALVGYLLSQSYKDRLEASVRSSLVYVSLSELRRQPTSKLLHFLHSIRARRLFLPFEDENSRCILPILHSLAVLTRARALELVGMDLRRQRLPRWGVAWSLLKLAYGSLKSLRSLSRSYRELTDLERRARIPLTRSRGRRVLYLNGNLSFGVKSGGSVGHVAGVVNALDKLGMPVVYAATERSNVLSSTVDFVHLAPSMVGIPFEANMYRHSRGCAERLKNDMEDGFHFIYQRMSLGNYAGVMLSRHTGLPLILEYNGSETWVQRNWGQSLRFPRLASRVEATCLKHAHLVVCVSEVLRDELEARGVERQRIVAYPNCIDPVLFDPNRFSVTDSRVLRRQHGIRADATVVGFIGTFGQWHGVEVLAEAIYQLATQRAAWLRQHRIHFLIVGDGLKMGAVRARLDNPSCASVVTLTGLVAQNQAPRYLAATDLLLAPHVPNPDGSPFFGSPTKLFEYMAMGKGIVASNLGQIGQVLEPALRATALPAKGPTGTEPELGVLCTPGDVSELCAGIEFLVEQPRWRELLGNNCRKQALAKYTWDRHTSHILERLSEIG